ncbi:PaaI family thioesterase [Sphingosinicella sp. BN140058]|uniref:PaaI family thioesterase n=1 Tax=Sphingosinicella sp. BN140058 TaxID=1892855 RepID=UPI001012EABD|nr:PaaI family thioesterase [Sphingosinicella sp. BN140058]QAY75769.1 PaaI family thioesterase [Sphingosinicella sp. BN140058]
MTAQYGLARAEDLQSLGGLELLRRMINGSIPGPTIARTLGFRLAEVDDGLAVFEMEVGPHLLNPLGSVHGGVALTLIDSAAGCALHTRLPAGVGYTSVETKVNFTRAIRPDTGVLRAEGRVVTQGRQIATAEARVLSADGKIVAHGTSTLMILRAR